ncbi:MAG: hypothetical protein R3A52_25610 [Polyangiales bacterium]
MPSTHAARECHSSRAIAAADRGDVKLAAEAEGERAANDAG